MTRINVGINPSQLVDEMLLAEHREIKRMCDLFKRTMASHIEPEIPEEFTLGQGHMKFFLDKGFYTEHRYTELKEECFRRGFSMTDFTSNWDIYTNTDMYEDYEPTEEDINIIKDRIIERLNSIWTEFVNKDYKGRYPFHYYEEEITHAKALELIIK